MIKKTFLVGIILLLWVRGSIFAQTETETPTASPTAASQIVTVKLLSDRDTLVLVIPDKQSVSLMGLSLSVVTAQDDIHTSVIVDDFPFLRLTSGLVEPQSCLVYRLFGSTNPLPIACDLPERIFRRDVARADVFWYDSVSEQPRVIAVYREEEFVTVCSSTAPECTISWDVISVTETPSVTLVPDRLTQVATATPTNSSNPSTIEASIYPCDGQIVSRTPATTVLNIVRESPSNTSQLQYPIQQDSLVQVLAMSEVRGDVWYHIQNSEGEILGWIPDNFLKSRGCS